MSLSIVIRFFRTGYILFLMKLKQIFSFFCFTLCLQFFPLLSFADIPDTVLIGEVKIVERLLHYQKQAGVKHQKIDSLVLSSLAANSLSQVLSENTPVFIKTYGRGSMASASFRGTAPSHTKVLWNDIEINNPMLGMVDFSLIPTWFIDDVSLSYGGASVKKTTGALGGCIELSNQAKWNKGLHFHTLSSIGQYHTYDQFFATSYSNKKWCFKTKAFYSSSENDFKFINRDIISSVDLSNGEKQHPRQTQQQAEYEKYGLMQELYFHASEKDMISAKMWVQKSDRNLPMLSSDEKNDRKEIDEEIKSNNFNRQYDESIRAVTKWKHYGDHMQYSTNFGYIKSDLDYFYDVRLYDGSITRRIDSKSVVNSYFAKVETEFSPTKKTKINSALNFQLHEVDSQEKINKTGYDESRNEMSFLLNAEQQWSKELSQSFSLQVPVNDGKSEPLIWVVGLQYQYVDKNVFRIQANITRNYHRPTLNDLYFQPGGNPDLKPEEGYTGEIDAGYTIIGNTYKLDLDLTYYQSKINDWILWLPAGNRGYWEPINVKRVRTKGVEFKAKLSGKLSDDFSYKIIANYAYTQSINKGEKRGEEDKSYGKQLPYIPKKSVNMITSILWKNTSLIAHFNYYSRRYTTSSNEPNTLRDYLYSYYMNNLSVSQRFQLSKKVRVKLQLKVNNLFDEEYRSILQRPMAGRNYTFLIDLKF